MDPDALANAFVEHYYSTFETNRAGLGNLYQDCSMLTFEGEHIGGSQNIVYRLNSLPFQRCKHCITSVDWYANSPAGDLLIVVSGYRQIAGQQRARKFDQMFRLMPTAQGSFCLLNDIFRSNHT